MTSTTNSDDTDYRLAYDASPRRYELRFAPDLERAVFSGSERLELEVNEPLSAIVMHALDLEIGDVSLRPGWASAGERLVEDERLACRVELDATDERVRFVAASPVEPGRYTLDCSFTGILNDKLCGFYRSVFTDDAGIERVIATTQFEDTDARRAFPCFDEPDRKAVFSVTLDVPHGLLGISNGPEIGVEELAGGVRRVRFGDTIPMSTYLVAFVVGPLEATDPVDVDGVALRVVHVPGKAHLTGPAIEVATHALRFFSDYFALPYPGEKVDLVAVPDFAAGAMENLGCITFREAILLADADRTARTEMERLAEVVEHELAHMWFGDLVTMSWWNGIWLNEAFATFMSLCCQDDYRPEWQCFVSFARGKGAALAIDGLHTTRPIEFPVRHPDEASAMFDVLTYEKGASVLWMVEQYLGRERFRAGVRRYLDKHRLANTETHDLWDAIEAEAGDVPIRAVMDSWIFQGGYPLVTAIAGDDARGAPVVELSQEPFAYLAGGAGDAGPASAIGRDWLVPVLAARAGTATAEPFRVLLGSEPVQIGAGRGPLVVNAGGAGFYRLRYDDRLRGELLDAFEELSALERYNFVADAWATVLAGRVPLESFFEILGRLGHESDPHVWSAVIGAIGLLDLVAPESERDSLSSFVRALLRPLFERIGWEKSAGEDDQVPVLRAALVAALGTVGRDEGVVARARALVAQDWEERAPIDADLAPAALGVVAAHATQAELDSILDHYRRPRDPMDEVRHLNALGRLTDPLLASEVHQLCLGEIRSQNAPYLLGSMLANRAIGEVTWLFLTENFDALIARFPANSIHRMLEGITGLAQLDDDGEPRFFDSVRAFCETRVEGARRRLVSQSLERLEVNVGFAGRVRPVIGALLGE